MAFDKEVVNSLRSLKAEVNKLTSEQNKNRQSARRMGDELDATFRRGSTSARSYRQSIQDANKDAGGIRTGLLSAVPLTANLAAKAGLVGAAFAGGRSIVQELRRDIEMAGKAADTFADKLKGMAGGAGLTNVIPQLRSVILQMQERGTTLSTEQLVDMAGIYTGAFENANIHQVAEGLAFAETANVGMGTENAQLATRAFALLREAGVGAGRADVAATNLVQGTGDRASQVVGQLGQLLQLAGPGNAEQAVSMALAAGKGESEMEALVALMRAMSTPEGKSAMRGRSLQQTIADPAALEAMGIAGEQAFKLQAIGRNLSGPISGPAAADIAEQALADDYVRRDVAIRRNRSRETAREFMANGERAQREELAQSALDADLAGESAAKSAIVRFGMWLVDMAYGTGTAFGADLQPGYGQEGAINDSRQGSSLPFRMGAPLPVVIENPGDVRPRPKGE